MWKRSIEPATALGGRLGILAGSPGCVERRLKVPALLRWTAIVFLVSTALDGLNWSGLVGQGNTLSSVVGVVLVVVYVLSFGLRARVGGSGWGWFAVFVGATLVTEFYRFATYSPEFATRSLRVYFTTIQMFVLFFIFRHIVMDLKTRAAVVKAYVWTSVLLSLAAIGTWVAGKSVGPTNRVSVLERNENEFAFACGMAALFLTWWILGSERRGSRPTKWMVLPVFSLLFATVLTGSRGGTLATAVGFSVVLAALYRARRAPVYAVVLPVLIAGVILALYFNPVLGDRLAAAARGTDLGTRPELIEAGLHLAAKHPVVGIGPAYDWYLGGELGFSRIAAHNTYLQVLLSFGIIGTIPFLAFLATISWAAWKGRRQPEGALALGAMAALLALFMTGHELNYKMMWVVLALVATISFDQRAAAVRPRRRSAVNGRFRAPLRLGPQ